MHGGGPQISSMLDRLGIPSEFRGGYRVTTPEAMDVVRMVLTGQINRELVEHDQRARPARGGTLAARTPACSRAAGAASSSTASSVDLGLVGDVVAVDPAAGASTSSPPAASRSSRRIAPDIDQPGQSLNVNADAAAAALAVALGAAKLVDPHRRRRASTATGRTATRSSRRSTSTELRALLPQLESGMIPKMTACLDAVDGGVAKAAIIDGRVPHSILLEDLHAATESERRWCRHDAGTDWTTVRPRP